MNSVKDSISSYKEFQDRNSDPYKTEDSQESSRTSSRVQSISKKKQ